MNSMLSKSKGSNGRATSFSSSMNKKKPAPPRPPQPSVNRMQTSQSFSTGSELKGRINQRSMSVSAKPDGDLIDFNAPTELQSQGKLQLQAIQGPPDFRYRVGASIFYIKSPLLNSVSHNVSKAASQPFSPPRPSAQAISKNAASSNNTSQNYTSKTATVATKYFSRPTIIKAQSSNDGTQSSNIYGNQLKGITTGSSNLTTTNQSNLYTNIPLEWDEPPKKYPPASVKPTIIKPLPPPKKPGLGSKTVEVSAPKTFSVAGQTFVDEPKPYYDEPPDFDDDFDDDDDDDDDFDTKPMPTEPPPPPPPNYEVEQWVDNTEEASSDYAIYSEPMDPVTTRAYAIALYDYFPEADGDLALQAGDLIYLTSKIDDSWLYGTCGGVEGMFPSNYVNVVVPLADVVEEIVPEPTYSPINVEQNSNRVSIEQNFVNYYASINYDFNAETESDLNLQAGGVVTILGRINDDWLYGEIQGSRGQFPASFVSPVPLDLPTLTF